MLAGNSELEGFLFSDKTTPTFDYGVETDKFAYQEKIVLSNSGMAAYINVRAENHVRKIWRNRELGFPSMHTLPNPTGSLWRQMTLFFLFEVSQFSSFISHFLSL